MQKLEKAPISGKPAKNLVIFMHGLGSNGEDLMGLVPFFEDSMPDCHFYSPNGIEPCDIIPFGYQWFSLQDRDPHVMEREISRSIPLVKQLIENKLKSLDLTYKDLILIGFSQGAMLSLYIAHELTEPIKAVIAFSGLFYPPTKIGSVNTPICLIHGKEDEVVPFSSMKDSVDSLRNVGARDFETYAIDNLAHSIDLNGIRFAQQFLLQRMG
ncbi:MAG: hypothetical protein EB127_06500 [Alphaproteobacteria bacterium]|nr:hypothetical protein [Alphaproteobacteria bacterium]